MNRVHQFDYRVITEFLTALDCPRSLTVLLLWQSCEFEQIVNLQFNPLDYNDVESAKLSLFATDLLRKHEDLPTNIDKASVALHKFKEAEDVCRLTNQRLRTRTCEYSALLYRMQRKIGDVLGKFDPCEFLDSSGWGPGSTLFIKRSEATFSNKFRSYAEVTQPLFELIKPWFDTQFPNWVVNPRIVQFNKVITVPKNAKTDRVIAVEPSLNLYFQKGIGAMISKRLKRFGVDLNTQERNQQLARKGSIDGLLATVDFSAASDTIASNLILDVLPFNWFLVLEKLRSGHGYIKGSRLFEYEKFSSMGNGFTFELESLIFWAAAQAVVPDDHPLKSEINVFGDDVIIPSDCYDDFRSFCDFIGFSVNNSKSYHRGNYRESCGKHYWNGNDITPIYNRRFLLKEEVMRFHNRVVELSRRSIADGFRDSRFQSVIKVLRNASVIKHCVPAGYGDIGLTTSFDEVSPVFNRKLQRGWYGFAHVPVSSSTYEDDEGVLLMHLFILDKKRQGSIGIRDSLPIGNDIPRPSRPRYKRKRLYFEEWPGLGPWI
jgi:hypothetical protein